MNEKSLEQLLAERSDLTTAMVKAAGGTPEEVNAACLALATNFLQSLELALGAISEPAHFLAIFALNTFANVLADTVPGSRDMAEQFAEMWDIESTVISFPHFDETEDDEE